MGAPRVFIIRHGETEWSLNGRHTGKTDIPLTVNGEIRVLNTGQALVGDSRLIVPRQLSKIYVSPRKRAQRTLELLNLGIPDHDLPWKPHGGKPNHRDMSDCTAKVHITENVREWDYGVYEGLTSSQIVKIRAEQGLQTSWEIWRDGCPGGESPQDVTDRLDRLIHDIRENYHRPIMSQNADDTTPKDVLIVAHGHILRALAMRWTGRTLQEGPAFLLEPGGVGTLRYFLHL